MLFACCESRQIFDFVYDIVAFVLPRTTTQRLLRLHKCDRVIGTDTSIQALTKLHPPTRTPSSTEAHGYEILTCVCQLEKAPAVCEPRRFKVDKRVHGIPPSGRVHTLLPYFCKIHFNIIITSASVFSKFLLHLWTVFIFHVLHACYTSRQLCLLRSLHSNNIWRKAKILKVFQQ